MQKNLAKTWVGSNARVLVGSRYIERIPVALVISEKEASAVFRTHKGVLDYLGLFSTDEKFCKWCRDLFLYYWEKAERWHPGIEIK
jgi:predicted transcriptional regulator